MPSRRNHLSTSPDDLYNSSLVAVKRCVATLDRGSLNFFWGSRVDAVARRFANGPFGKRDPQVWVRFILMRGFLFSGWAFFVSRVMASPFLLLELTFSNRSDRRGRRNLSRRWSFCLRTATVHLALRTVWVAGALAPDLRAFPTRRHDHCSCQGVFLVSQATAGSYGRPPQNASAA